jgi:hypothetical protein
MERIMVRFYLVYINGSQGRLLRVRDSSIKLTVGLDFDYHIDIDANCMRELEEWKMLLEVSCTCLLSL